MARDAEPDLLLLAERVYTLPGDLALSRPWLGAVVTGKGTVLVDSGNGPVHAAALQAALEKIGAPPVTHILLTHHHWDHVFGNASFPGAHIVAHEQTQHHLEVMAGEPWSEEYVLSKAEGFPRGRVVMEFMRRAVPDWSQFRAVPADETFRDRYELNLGGYRFTVEHVGGQHEPDQCIVHVQPGNVLFLGDATYGRGPKDSWDRAALDEALRGFLARGADWYVEGHRPPVRAEAFAARIERRAL
jgi:glyoxylase-like metal-dependent hydrolase (beta-lactamase superfamily II)